MEACEEPSIECFGRKVNEGEVVEMDVEKLRCLCEDEEDVWKLRSLFDQIVGILNKDLVVDDKVDPFPVLWSDGRGVKLLVDLFTLYEAVWMRGGCGRVCKKGMWDSVAAELGYRGMKKALKSIYMKYLNELDCRVSEVSKVKRSRVGKGSTEKNLDMLNPKLIEGKSEVNGFDDERRGKEVGVSQVDFDVESSTIFVRPETEKYNLDLLNPELIGVKSKVNGFDDERRGKEVSVTVVDSEIVFCIEPEESNLDLTIREFALKLSRYWKRTQGGGEKNRSHDKDEKSVSLKAGASNVRTGSRKRKREPIHSMLKWVTRIAKHPMISAPDINHKSKEYYAQSLLARQVLFVKGPDGGNEASLEQNNTAIQASYYDDHPGFNNQSTGILRCSKRVSSLEEMEACEKPSVEMVERKVNEGEVVEMDLEKWICLSEGEDEEKLRNLFDQIVGILNKDLVVDDKFNPFPALCSDGRGVELLVYLFKLYKAVWMRGGCVRASKKGMWGSVAAELRFHGMKRALKSIYMKYLNELDRRVSEVSKVKKSRVGNHGKGSTEKKGKSKVNGFDDERRGKEAGVSQVDFESSVSSVRLKSEKSNLDILNPKLIEGKSKVNGFDDERRGEEMFVSLVNSEFSVVCVKPEKSNLDLTIREFARKLSRYWKKTQGGGEKNHSHDKDEKSVSLKTDAFKIGTGSRKRKREPVHSMLKWVTSIAKHPMNSAADINHKSKEYYEQSLLARRVLFVRGPDGGKDASLEQNKMTIQASYYDDHPNFNNQSTGILRCSKRLSSLEEMEACEKPSVEMVERKVNEGEVERKVNEGEVVEMDVEKWICSEGEDEEKLRSLFGQIVGILNEDLVVNDKVNPFPVLCSDGRGVELLVDLFKLYKAVWMRGGCVRVCKKGMWDSVAAELRFHGMKKALKSIYMKYLNELNRRVYEISKVERSRVGKGSTEKKLDLLNPKSIVGKSKVNGFDDERTGKEVSVSLVDSEIIVGIEPEKSNLDMMIREFARKLSSFWKRTQGGGEKNHYHDKDEKSVSLKTGALSIGTCSRKRKREPIHSMLKWVTTIAKHPMNSAADINHKSKEYYEQSLLARRVLFVKGPDGGKEVSLDQVIQNKTTIQASYYDDHPGFKNQSTGILRCSKRVSSLANSFLEEGSAKLRHHEEFNNKSDICHLELDVENHEGLLKPDHSVKDSIDTNFPSTSNSSTSWIGDIPAEKVTSVGPGYQAEVPEWTGIVIESDPKWLGTKIWPSDNKQNRAVVNLTAVRRGISDSCGCKLPGSVACTRFHIAEKKLVLKRELGSVFYLWRFDQMGEEVALRWSRKEEDRFTQMVRRNPPSEGKCFWDFGPQYLRKKTRDMLVSYYFNVFVLRRRSYQNRATPKEIDSDDDEKEFETLGGMLGDEIISLPDSVFSDLR